MAQRRVNVRVRPHTLKPYERPRYSILDVKKDIQTNGLLFSETVRELCYFNSMADTEAVKVKETILNIDFGRLIELSAVFDNVNYVASMYFDNYAKTHDDSVTFYYARNYFEKAAIVLPKETYKQFPLQKLFRRKPIVMAAYPEVLAQSQNGGLVAVTQAYTQMICILQNQNEPCICCLECMMFFTCHVDLIKHIVCVHKELMCTFGRVYYPTNALTCMYKQEQNGACTDVITFDLLRDLSDCTVFPVHTLFVDTRKFMADVKELRDVLKYAHDILKYERVLEIDNVSKYMSELMMLCMKWVTANHVDGVCQNEITQIIGHENGVSIELQVVKTILELKQDVVNVTEEPLSEVSEILQLEPVHDDGATDLLMDSQETIRELHTPAPPPEQAHQEVATLTDPPPPTPPTPLTFEETLLEEVTCPLCAKVMVDPFSLTVCGDAHPVCFSCLHYQLTRQIMYIHMKCVYANDFHILTLLDPENDPERVADIDSILKDNMAGFRKCPVCRQMYGGKDTFNCREQTVLNSPLMSFGHINEMAVHKIEVLLDYWKKAEKKDELTQYRKDVRETKKKMADTTFKRATLSALCNPVQHMHGFSRVYEKDIHDFRRNWLNIKPNTGCMEWLTACAVPASYADYFILYGEMPWPDFFLPSLYNRLQMALYMTEKSYFDPTATLHEFRLMTRLGCVPTRVAEKRKADRLKAAAANIPIRIQEIQFTEMRKRMGLCARLDTDCNLANHVGPLRMFQFYVYSPTLHQDTASWKRKYSIINDPVLFYKLVSEKKDKHLAFFNVNPSMTSIIKTVGFQNSQTHKGWPALDVDEIAQRDEPYPTLLTPTPDPMSTLYISHEDDVEVALDRQRNNNIEEDVEYE